MIIVLLESPSNIILPFLDELKAKYPKSSCAVVSPRDNLSDLVAKFSKPPLFTAGWLIECPVSVRVGVVKKLDSLGNNYVVVRVTSNAEKEKALHALADLDVTFIDNYNLGKEELVSWICSELKCNKDVATAIGERVSWKLNSIVAAIGTLSILGDVKKSDVAKYVRAANSTNVSDIVPYILGCARRSVRYSGVIDVIMQYQWGVSWLVKYLVGQLDVWLAIWEWAGLGLLTLQNVDEFLLVNKDSRLSKVTSSQVVSKLAWTGNVSLEFIEYVRQHFALLDTSDRLCIYKIIQLIKLGG